MGSRIVVGVDGSEHGRGALEFAVEEARRRPDATVVAVMAYPLLTTYPGIEFGMVEIPRESVERSTRAALSDALQDVPTDVEITQEVAEGSPAYVLIDASHDADLVVVGSRGRGGFRSLLLGSTSHQVASHAHCPVVVVPSHAHHHEDGDDG